MLNEVEETIRQSAYSQIFKENNKRVRSITASINNITSAEVYKHLQSTLDNLDKSINIKIKGEQEENQKFIEQKEKTTKMHKTSVKITVFIAFHMFLSFVYLVIVES